MRRRALVIVVCLSVIAAALVAAPVSAALSGSGARSGATAAELPGSVLPRAPVEPRAALGSLWIGGDSMAYQIQFALKDKVANAFHPKAFWLRGKSISGIVRIDFYNWPAKLKVEMPKLRPKAVVFMIGTNDGQAMPVKGGAYRFGTTPWKRVYRARVGSMMSTMLHNGVRRVYWIGMPIMRSGAFGRKMALINSIFKAQAAAHPGVVYIDAWRLFSSSSGGYVGAWRSGDGMHFNMTGVYRLVNAVIKTMHRDW